MIIKEPETKKSTDYNQLKREHERLMAMQSPKKKEDFSHLYHPINRDNLDDLNMENFTMQRKGKDNRTREEIVRVKMKPFDYNEFQGEDEYHGNLNDVLNQAKHE